MLEGQAAGTPVIDNPTPAATPAPAAPEIGNAAPTPEATPPVTTPQFQPGDRSREVLDAILALPEGADPESLFQPQAAATPPQGTTPPATPEPTPASVTEPLVIPDKFKNPDGTPNVAAIVKSYAELERSFGEQGNKLGEVSQLKQELQQLRAMVTQPPAQPAQPAEPAAPVEDVPKFPWEVEMSPEDKEKALEEYYADPLAAQAKRDRQAMQAMEYRIAKTLEKVLQPLTPVIEKHQYESDVNYYSKQLMDFAEANPDIQDVLPEMQTICNMLGSEAVKAMEQAGKNPVAELYNAAKALYKPAPAPPPTIEQMIANPENRQKILSDQSIKNEILKSQVEAVQTGAPPPMIGGQPGGVPPSAPAEHIGSAKEAGRHVAKFFGLGGL